jgi:hypothetical protein
MLSAPVTPPLPCDEYSDSDSDDSSDTLPLPAPLSARLSESMAEARLFVLTSSSVWSLQSEVSAQTRITVVDWLSRVVSVVKFQRTTLHNAIFMFDQLLARVLIPKRDVQLFAATCLWISGKLDEWRTLTLDCYVAICQNQFSVESFKATELRILSVLDFRMGYPAASVFLPSFLMDLGEDESDPIAWFFLDVSLYVCTMVEVAGHIVAAASVVAALAGAAKPVRVAKLLRVAGGCDRAAVVGVVIRLAEVAANLLDKKVGGLCEHYCPGNSEQFVEVVRRVSDFLARSETP